MYIIFTSLKTQTKHNRHYLNLTSQIAHQSEKQKLNAIKPKTDKLAECEPILPRERLAPHL